MGRTTRAGTLLGALAVGLLAQAVAAAEPQVLGWIESVLLLPERLEVKAKLDTGARTSSLDAKDIGYFRRDGGDWVRFTVALTDSQTGAQVVSRFERPVLRKVKVRGAGGEDHRPVVQMALCIGERRYDEEFSLRNRSEMLYPVLIGRRTLEHLGAVDVSRTFTLKPNCSD